jgi:hypothetical protein
MAYADGPYWIEDGANDNLLIYNVWGQLADLPGHMYPKDKEARRDTARLLAAAPQLLNVLTETADWLGNLSNCKASDDCLKTARDLITHLNGGK